MEPLTPFELIGAEIGKGWWPLVEPIYDKIQALNVQGAQIEISQIKENFGSLCILVNNAPGEIMTMIRDAEEKSIHICEHCGKPAQRVSNEYSWIYTLCSDCLKEKGVEVTETLENPLIQTHRNV